MKSQTVPQILGAHTLTLVPPLGGSPAQVASARNDQTRAQHEALLREAQRLRGAIYAADGAIKLTPGMPEYVDPLDRLSWHVVMRDSRMKVCGALRVTFHEVNCTVSDLAISSCPLFCDAEWHDRGWAILSKFLHRASELGVRVVEAGGWALEDSLRAGRKGALLALSGWALTRVLGGAMIIVLVTSRHGASRMTRFLGGREFSDERGPVPAYFDERYGCDMELIQFHSYRVNPIFEGVVQDLSNIFERDLASACAKPPLSPAISESDIASLGPMVSQLEVALQPTGS